MEGHASSEVQGQPKKHKNTPRQERKEKNVHWKFPFMLRDTENHLSYLFIYLFNSTASA